MGRGGSVAKYTQAAWPAVDAIIGNPPFLGGSKMREELGDDYTETLRKVYADKVPGGADLVCYWFAKARDAIVAQHVNRVGLVATNSIRQRSNRPVLERVVAESDIFNAWSDEEWVNEAAAVRVSIICFKSARAELVEGSQKADSGSTGSPRMVFLDGRDVANINANLTGSESGTGALDVTYSGVLPDKKLIVIARDEDAMFGLLCSRLHEVWTLALGGNHGVGNDPYYNPTECFQTFPFPSPTEQIVTEIAAAAKSLTARQKVFSPTLAQGCCGKE